MSQFITEGSQGRQEFQIIQRLKTETIEEMILIHFLTGSLLLAFETDQDNQPGDDATHNRVGPLTSINNQDNLPQANHD